MVVNQSFKSVVKADASIYGQYDSYATSQAELKFIAYERGCFHVVGEDTRDTLQTGNWRRSVWSSKGTI